MLMCFVESFINLSFKAMDLGLIYHFLPVLQKRACKLFRSASVSQHTICIPNQDVLVVHCDDDVFFFFTFIIRNELN